MWLNPHDPEYTSSTHPAYVIDEADLRAHTIGAWQTCEPHEMYTGYSAVMETTGPTAVYALVRTARRLGHLTDFIKGHPAAGGLTIFDAAGDFVAESIIPTPESWEWWATAAELRPTVTDCAICFPTLYRRTHGDTKED